MKTFTLPQIAGIIGLSTKAVFSGCYEVSETSIFFEKSGFNRGEWLEFHALG